jgi:hypothetical protein
MWSSRWNENWQGKPKNSEKTCSSATLSTVNPTWPDTGSATNRLSYGAAFSLTVQLTSMWHLLALYLNYVVTKYLKGIISLHFKLQERARVFLANFPRKKMSSSNKKWLLGIVKIKVDASSVKIYFNTILPSIPRSPNWPLLLKFLQLHFACIFYFLIYAICMGQHRDRYCDELTNFHPPPPIMKTWFFNVVCLSMYVSI